MNSEVSTFPMKTSVLGFMVVFVFASMVSRAAQLHYDEASERVIIETAQGTRVYQYREQRQGFVSPQGDWVGWRDAGYWEGIPKHGARERYDIEGRLIWREQVQAVRSASRGGGYDPRQDYGDTGTGGGDAPAAMQYLQQRGAMGAAPRPVSGEEYGAPIVEESLGGNLAGKQKADREAWAARPGVHAGDPEAAMETGEVPDPLKKLADTVGSIQSAVQGVSDTIHGAHALEEQIENFGEPGYSPPPMPGARNNPPDDDPSGAPPSGAAKSARGGMPPPAAGGTAGIPGTGPATDTGASGPTPYGGAHTPASSSDAGDAYRDISGKIGGDGYKEPGYRALPGPTDVYRE